MNALPIQPVESKFKTKVEDKSGIISKNSQVRISQSSRERLPGISTHTKLQMHEQRCENQIFRHIRGVDRKTISNPHHVSEYCKEIHECMLLSEDNWCPDPNYMQK